MALRGFWRGFGLGEFGGLPEDPLIAMWHLSNFDVLPNYDPFMVRWREIGGKAPAFGLIRSLGSSIPALAAVWEQLSHQSR